MAKSNKMFWAVGLIGLGIIGSFLEKDKEINNVSKVVKEPITEQKLGKICKSGIATVMYRSPETMTSTALPNKVMQISWIRPNDSKRFVYKCKINGNKILWGEKDGGWNDVSDLRVIRFRVKQNTISITQTFVDGSSSENTYYKSSL